MKKLTFLIVPYLLSAILAGCASSEEPPTEETKTPVQQVLSSVTPTETPVPVPKATSAVVGPGCEKELLFTVSNTLVWRMTDHDAIFFQAGMTIDADGAPDAYHPDDIGTDYLGNAGQPGSWWALVTDEDGKPVVQGPDDPMPGYYVSTTALEDTTKAITDTHRFVNSNEVPYVVLPYDQRGEAQLGDFAVVVNRANSALCYAIFADLGPPNHIGEGSVALAEALGLDASPKHGGTDGGVAYVLFPDSGNGKPRSLEEINSEAGRLFESWGGMARIEVCLP